MDFPPSTRVEGEGNNNNNIKSIPLLKPMSPFLFTSKPWIWIYFIHILSLFVLFDFLPYTWFGNGI